MRNVDKQTAKPAGESRFKPHRAGGLAICLTCAALFAGMTVGQPQKAPESPKDTFLRFSGNPLLDGPKLGLRRIMFPSVIRVPEWVKQPKGKFYMYYAEHSGTSIYVAAADRPEGPWKPLPDPVLTIDRTPFPDHISSPDVLVVPEQKRFYLYFHGAYLDLPEYGYKREQPASVTISDDPLHFPASKVIIATPGVNFAYFRAFRRDGWFYAIGRQQRLFRSRDAVHWEGGPYLLSWDRFGDLTREYPLALSSKEITGRTIHAGLVVHPEDQTLDCYFSLKDETGVSLQKVRISTRGDWLGWAPVEMPVRALTAGDPLDALPDGAAYVRDPFVLAEEGRLYLYYVAGPEKYICLATSKAQVGD
ncbi:MAG: hypothetical protein ACE15E_02945 [Acidobacteriota bacterium]